MQFFQNILAVWQILSWNLEFNPKKIYKLKKNLYQFRLWVKGPIPTKGTFDRSNLIFKIHPT
jgi:hypothetical protein